MKDTWNCYSGCRRLKTVVTSFRRIRCHHPERRVRMLSAAFRSTPLTFPRDSPLYESRFRTSKPVANSSSELMAPVALSGRQYAWQIIYFQPHTLYRGVSYGSEVESGRGAGGEGGTRFFRRPECGNRVGPRNSRMPAGRPGGLNPAMKVCTIQVTWSMASSWPTNAFTQAAFEVYGIWATQGGVHLHPLDRTHVGSLTADLGTFPGCGACPV